jgi:uncharacterized protein (TIGR02757 family)
VSLLDRDLKPLLECLYAKLNKKELVNPDPLIFLYDFNELKDREIAGLIASSLAYGRVAQILVSVRKILGPMDGKPHDFILSHEKKDFEKIYAGFKHRFTGSDDIVKLLTGIKKALTEYDNLENLYLQGVELFAYFLNNSQKSYLLPSPVDGSACKRLNLYFRWMVRHDNVDPGGWKKSSKQDLIIPLDTHMFKAAKLLGFTKRNSADLKTAIEITEHFAHISPDDPVKYDFALTRLGIRDDMSFQELITLINQHSCETGF